MDERLICKVYLLLKDDLEWGLYKIKLLILMFEMKYELFVWNNILNEKCMCLIYSLCLCLDGKYCIFVNFIFSFYLNIVRLLLLLFF